MFQENSAKPYILIVDDKESNIIALNSQLEDLECNILNALSGDQALKKLLDHKVALILLDVQMPDLDGFQTAELIRGLKETRSIPIIFVTALSKEEKHVFKGYERGAVDYLFKPVDPIILRSKVRIFLELYNKEQLLKQNVKELEYALAEIETLKGLIPICAWCKKVREDENYWIQIEKYISKRSKASFSHSICPECEQKYFKKSAKKNRDKFDLL